MSNRLAPPTSHAIKTEDLASSRGDQFAKSTYNSQSTSAAAHSSGSMRPLQGAVFPSSDLHATAHSDSAMNDTRTPVSRDHSHRGNDGLSNDAETNMATPEDRSTSKSMDDEAAAMAPAWTEMKTKAGKDRKRLPLACIACRRKKIRCSGEHPACKHCIRSRIPCVYKVTTRKAAPRTDYMAMLDKRLKRMEDRVIKVLPKEQQDIVESTGRATLKPNATLPLRRGSATTKKRAADQTLADLEQWSRAEQQQPESRPSPNSAAVTQGAANPYGFDEHSLLQDGADKLPPKEVQEHLAEVFFDYVYGQSYHLLHKPSFMRKLAQDQVAPVLLLAVCAMAARFSNHPAVRTEPAFLRGEEWAAAAREISLRRYDSPNITVLIVYLILTLHEFGTCQGGRSWMFGGMAQRMAYALQLHQDLEYDPSSLQSGHKVAYSFIDREIRRRTMWACFLMDRFCSSGTERPTFITVEHVHARLPIAERLFIREIPGVTENLSGTLADGPSSTSKRSSDAEENMGVAAYIIRIIAVWGDAITYHNLGGKQRDRHPPWDEKSDFHKLSRSISKWNNDLPDRLRYNADNLATHATERIANQFIFMHIIYHQTILFVNRFALPSPTTKPKTAKSTPPAFMKECAKAAWTAANKVSTLVRDGMLHNVVAPFAGYAAFFSGAVHIQGTFSKNEALQASSKQHLTWNINYLTKMKKHWGMFHFMTENLRELYRKLVDHTRNASQQSGPGDEADNEYIFQYGDWFDRYPRGLGPAGLDSPHSESTKEPGADAGLGQQGDLHTVEDFFANLSPSDHGPQLPQNKARKQQRRQLSRTNSLEISDETMRHPTSSPVPPVVQREPQIPLHQPQPFNPELTQQPSMPEYQDQMSGMYNDANMSYPGAHTMINPMTSYQAELAQLTNNGMSPLVGNLSMEYGAPGIPAIPLEQSTYDGSTSGTWFMPYNLDTSSLSQTAGAFGGGGHVGWSAPFGGLQQSSMVLHPSLDLDGTQTGMGGEPNISM